MSEIYVVGLKEKTNIQSIFVNEIIFKDFFINLDDFSNIIFTSKNAIKSCIQNNLNLKNKKIFCIGEKTAEYLKKINLEAFYTGQTAHAKDFKYEILQLLKYEKCIYFRAKEIISDLDDFLIKNNIDLTSIIAYENIRLKTPLDNNFIPFNKKLKNDDILIFLAPSGVRDFLYHFKFIPTNIISIGKSTQNELKKNNINSITPNYPSLENCLNLAYSLKS